MVRDWEALGLDTSRVLRIPGRLPGLYVITTDAGGERAFHYWRREAAVRRLASVSGSAGLRQRLAGVDLVYLSGITLAILTPRDRETLLQLLVELRAEGVRLGFDTNYRPALWRRPGEARRVFNEVGSRSDFVLPSAGDERALFGDRDARASAERWLEAGAGEVAVKDGAQPCWFGDEREVTSLPVVNVERVVDTTAAGDAFNGAYLAARLTGAPIDTAVRRGHALARVVVQHRGALVPAG